MHVTDSNPPFTLLKSLQGTQVNHKLFVLRSSILQVRISLLWRTTAKWTIRVLTEGNSAHAAILLWWKAMPVLQTTARPVTWAASLSVSCGKLIHESVNAARRIPQKARRTTLGLAQRCWSALHSNACLLVSWPWLGALGTPGIFLIKLFFASWSFLLFFQPSPLLTMLLSFSRDDKLNFKLDPHRCFIQACRCTGSLTLSCRVQS